MIYVTVGSTYFDELIEIIDLYVGQNKIRERVLAQIGSSKYEPKNIPFYKYKDSIYNDILSSDLVITAGGLTTLEVLSLKKKILGIPNPHVADNHQEIYLSFLEKKGWLPVCRDLKDLPKYIEIAMNFESKFDPGENLGPDLVSFLDSL